MSHLTVNSLFNNEIGSQLPIVVVKLVNQPFPTNGSREEAKAKRDVVLNIFDNNAKDYPNGEINCTTDAAEIIDATMHYRGASSLGFPKHQYAVKLSKDPAKEWNKSANKTLKTENFLGMPYGGKSWVFNAPQPSLDGTYLRNVLSFQLQNQFNKLLLPLGKKVWAPRTRFFELLIQNPGDSSPAYAGLYLVFESIEFNKNRVAVKSGMPALLYKIDTNLDKCDTPVKFGGLTFSIDDVTNMSLKKDINKCQYILPDFWPDAFTYWTNMLQNPAANKVNVKINGNEQSLLIKTDADSFALAFILNELVKDPDGYNRSTYLYQVYDPIKDDSLTMYAGPLWDKNLAYDLRWKDNQDSRKVAPSPVYGVPYTGTMGWTFNAGKHIFWKQAFSDPLVQQKICYYWVGAINSILSANTIIPFIDEKNNWIKERKGGEATSSPVQRDCDRYYPNTICTNLHDFKTACLEKYIDPKMTSKVGGGYCFSYNIGRLEWMKQQLGVTQEQCLLNIKKVFQ